MRCSTPLSSSYSTIQTILPNILTTAVVNKRRAKKRVRFALTLESIDEDTLAPDPSRISSARIQSNRRTVDPWREDGLLYGAYVEYLQKQEPSTVDVPSKPRPSRPLLTSPEPEESDSGTFTTTYVLPMCKSPEPPVEFNSPSASPGPPLHLPRIIERSNGTKRPNQKKTVSPVVHSPTKQRVHLDIPSRPASSKKVSPPVGTKPPPVTHYSPTKRADFALPSMGTLPSQDKLMQGDRPFSAKLLHDYFQSKKFTEIITNPLPGVNNQIHPTPERSPLPYLQRKPSSQSSSRTTNELYFFQNYRPDNYSPVMHSTH